MSEYWIISAPGEKTPQNTFERLNSTTSTGSERLSENYRFNIPELKVGTLDVLVALSDDLVKLDTYTESVVRKISNTLEDVLESSAKGNLTENLTVRESSPVTYLQKFSWDLAKYPVKQSPRSIADIILKEVGHVESDLKSRYNAYNNLKSNLQQLERKTTGSLLTRNIADLVKKEDFVLDSEYLITLVVIVPKAYEQDWWNTYAKLSNKVVPFSSKKLFEDSENALVSVTLFKLVVDTFKNKCRESKFSVRDFTYCEEEIAAGREEMSKLETDKKRQFGPLVKWLKVNFGESFVAWLHVKALRVFVESVLRYGLPVNFQAMVVKPLKKNHKRLRDALNQLYGHLDSTALSGQKMSNVEIPGLSLNAADYFPYVYYKLALDMLEPSR